MACCLCWLPPLSLWWLWRNQQQRPPRRPVPRPSYLDDINQLQPVDVSGCCAAATTAEVELHSDGVGSRRKKRARSAAVTATTGVASPFPPSAPSASSYWASHRQQASPMVDPQQPARVHQPSSLGGDLLGPSTSGLPPRSTAPEGAGVRLLGGYSSFFNRSRPMGFDSRTGSDSASSEYIDS